MQNETRTLEPGTLVDGRYQIVNRIGRGGFATVYRSQHMQLDRPAALKILDPITSGTSQNFIERFLSEARIVANLRHPNVVMIYDFGVVREDQPYIAMDLLEGHDLETELANHGPMEPQRAKKLFLGVLDALNAGHRKQIVHKDLKPSNLFLVHPRTDREKLVVLDYGIARVADSDSPRLTQTGGYTGTPAYMPPEYIRDSIVSPTNDVYQIGLILIEVLTGEPVINARTSVACMVAHLGGSRNIPDWIMASSWAPVLTKALEIEHEERFQNAGEFMSALSVSAVPLPPIETENGKMGLADSSAAIIEGSNYTPHPAIVVPTGSALAQNLVPAGGLAPEAGTAPLASYTPKVQVQEATQPDTASRKRTTQPDPGYESASQRNAHLSGSAKKKKSKLIWFLLLFFVALPMLFGAIFLTVIYGYYGGFTEYGKALRYSINGKDSTPRLLKNRQPNANPLLTNDVVSTYMTNQPKADIKKLQRFIQARFMVFNLDNQLDIFAVSVRNYSYAKGEDLTVPDGTELLQLAVTLMNLGLQIKGGSHDIDKKGAAFSKEVKRFRIALEDLFDYYKVEKGYLKDHGARGKKLHKAANQASQRMQKSYKRFGDAVEANYKARFNRCAQAQPSDSFGHASCILFLKAWDLDQAILKGGEEVKAIKKYTEAIAALKRAERASSSKLELNNPNGQHTNFIVATADFLEESQKWIDRSTPTKSGDREALPDAALFVHMALYYLLQSYYVVVE